MRPEDIRAGSAVDRLAAAMQEATSGFTQRDYVVEGLTEVDADLVASAAAELGGTPALTFDRLSAVNRARCVRWHGDGEPWSGADWSNAMCGEAGEAANVVKKLRRIETRAKVGALDAPEEGLREALADEIADVVCYLDLLANYYGIDVEAAVVAKFNRVSERQGFPERLP